MVELFFMKVDSDEDEAAQQDTAGESANRKGSTQTKEGVDNSDGHLASSNITNGE